MPRKRKENAQQEGYYTLEQEDRVIREIEAEKFPLYLRSHDVKAPKSRDETRARLATVNAQIAQWSANRREPTRMESAKGMAINFIWQKLLRWWLFPINKLPVEILQRIFIFAVLSAPYGKISQARMILASVCSHWRWAAIGTPKLWSIILMKAKTPFPLFELCLQRAKARLTLVVDQRGAIRTGSKEQQSSRSNNVQALMLSIARYFNQIRELVIYVDTWAEILAVGQVLQSVPPSASLQRLELHRNGHPYVTLAPGNPTGETTKTPCRLFGGVLPPRLYHLSFDGVYIDFRPRFQNLRVLEMRNMGAEHLPAPLDFLSVLKYSPHLEKLALSAAGPAPQVIENKAMCQTVLLLHLRELELGSLTPTYLSWLMQFFHGPNLKRLTLLTLLNGDYAPFLEDLTGRFPEVTEMIVDCLDSRDTRVLSLWLRTMPYLKYLRFGRVMEEFFEALTQLVPGNGPNDREPRYRICPYLRYCELNGYFGYPAPAFKRFYKARKDTLESITVFNASFLDDKAAKWLRETGIANLVPTALQTDPI